MDEVGSLIDISNLAANDPVQNGSSYFTLRGVYILIKVKRKDSAYNVLSRKYQNLSSTHT